MLNLNPETVCFLIDKAREFHAKEQVVIPEEPTSPADDWARQVLADHEDDATYQELATTIADLDVDQQITLVALMWLGRDDYDLGEWQSAMDAASEAWTANAASYLIGTPLLASYLEEGLRLHGYTCDTSVAINPR